MGVGNALGMSPAPHGEGDARELPLARCRRVEFHHAGARPQVVDFPPTAPPEIVVQRRDFDALLLDNARGAGAEIRQNEAVSSVAREADGWRVCTSRGEIYARQLIAADGRNSVVARSLGLLPRRGRDRVGWQKHLPLPGSLRETIAMFFLPSGYGGLADCGGGWANLCLVAHPDKIRQLSSEVVRHFDLEGGDMAEAATASSKKAEGMDSWQTITPIRRAPARIVAGDRLFLAGDVARVVEPFTGEGIYYAVRSGLLAGEGAVRELATADSGVRWYREKHGQLYRGRLWINQLSRWAGEHSALTARLLGWPGVGRYVLPVLTRKVIVPG